MIESSCSLIGECMDGKEKYTFNHKTECFLFKRQTDNKRQYTQIRKKDIDKKGPVTCQGQKMMQEQRKKPTTPIT